MSDIQALKLQARKAGFTILYTGSGHLKWIPPCGGPFVISGSTPSDPRSFHTLRKQLGLEK